MDPMRASVRWLLAAACAGPFLAVALARSDEGQDRGTTDAWGRVPASAPPFPDSPAGRRLCGWLAAFNSQDREMIRRFNLGAFDDADSGPSMDDGSTGLDWRVAELFGVLDVVRVEGLSDHEAVAEAKARSGGWVRVELEVGPDEPYRITRVRFGPRSGQ
jgi:hypothetical protein